MLRPLLLALACLTTQWPVHGRENILLILADDVGVDRVRAYQEHPGAGPTPNIDALAGRGILFRNAWATPLCSPTRATLLTGRYPFRTGIGTGAQSQERGLPLEEITLPEMLAAGTEKSYTSILLGKWHLAGKLDPEDHPLQQGFHYAASTQSNLRDYFSWTKVVNGAEEPCTEYATTDTVDDALRILPTLPEPWFALVSFHAAHTPYHAPPAELHSFELSGLPARTPVLHHKAMVEALDCELGRLLTGLEETLMRRTNVIFMGDNGSPRDTIEEPWDPSHGKNTLYEGGVRVPLIVAGPRVRKPASDCLALVDASDLYATVAELAGVDLARFQPRELPLDSVSLAPYLSDPGCPSSRRSIYTESFRPNGQGGEREKDIRAIRDQRYKLLYNAIQNRQQLYDLQSDPLETTNLLSRRHRTPEIDRVHSRLLRTLLEIRR